MAAKDKIETGFTFAYDDQGGTVRDLSGDLIPGSVKIPLSRTYLTRATKQFS